MGDSKIQWCDKVWNVVTGCSKVSEGCRFCYAERMAKRLKGRYGYPQDDPFKVTLHLDRLDEPLRWKKPQRVFVSSMGDLFHPDVPTEFIMSVMSAQSFAPQHTYLWLTKRPKRMGEIIRTHFAFDHGINLWLGVSVENQDNMWRIEELLKIPAAVKFVSFEPLLESVDVCVPYGQGVGELLIDYLDWIIVGGESGPGARPMKYEWAFDLCEQTRDANIPFFYKQGIDDDGNWCKMPKLQGIIWDQLPGG